MKTLRQLLPLLAAVAGLLVLFRLLVGNFLSAENMLDLAQQISVNAILAFGMTLVILIGGIDLSVGALLALVGVTTVAGLITFCGTETQSLGGLIAAVLLGFGAAAVLGAFNGLCAAQTRMPPFIITLGTMLVARGAALRFNEGQPIHIPDAQKLFLALGNGRLCGAAKLPVPVLVMLVLFTLAAVLLHRTRFGQHLYAIGGNREAARYTGIPVARVEMAVYVICALLTAVAGMINASQLYSGEPIAGQGFELNAIAAVVVGGTSFTGGIGTMYGTLIGAVIIGILDKGLNQAGVHFSLQYIVKGLVILAAVYVDVRKRAQSR
ncbi:MAG: ABC transporter permease [Planctomycetota bacterium]